jgi:hypothetical protein
MIKPGELYHCRIVGGGHGDGEYLAEIVRCPKGKTEFSDIGRDNRGHIRKWYGPDILFYCIAAAFKDYQSILLCSTVEGFKKSIIRKVPRDELPLFIGWHCTERYQDLLKTFL